MKKGKYIIFIFILFIIDQISKIIIMNNLKINSSIKIIKDFFYITYTKNQGAAFGILNGKTIFIVLISLGVLAYLIFELFFHKKRNLYLDIGNSLLIGGLIGNLFDRIYYGYVRDFLDFIILDYDFAIFNIADIFIVVGAFIFFIGALLEGKNENSNN